jgi:predicted naringenin-chalcone synthase
MFFQGISTAVPPNCYTQLEVWEAMSASDDFARLSRRGQALLRKVLNSDNGIDSRQLALDSLHEAFTSSADDLHQRFELRGASLASEAAQGALNDAGVSAGRIDALIVSTCTGYLCPGLTSYVSERLALRSDCKLLDLVGQGCGAALPNLATARDILRGAGAEHVLSVCVEVCSAAYYLDDDPGVLISACLFGDGAAAAVLGNTAAANHPAVRWSNDSTFLNPANRDLLRFEQRDGRLRNILMPDVPAVAAKDAKRVCNQVLENSEMTISSVDRWLFHPGGRDVLNELEREFGLQSDETRLSRELLRTNGNMSSPSVLFVLERAMRSDPDPGKGHWWLASFGAGFSSHGALLEVG